MKLSLKVEYACQVLAQLGYTYGQPELPHIEQLARLEGIPPNYLVQILNELRTAGLIISKRGKQGGYALARSPVEISLLDVINAIEGEVLSCSSGSTGHSAARMRSVWELVAREWAASLSRQSIAAMMDQPTRDMYHI